MSRVVTIVVLEEETKKYLGGEDVYTNIFHSKSLCLLAVNDPVCWPYKLRSDYLVILDLVGGARGLLSFGWHGGLLLVSLDSLTCRRTKKREMSVVYGVVTLTHKKSDIGGTRCYT